METVKLLWFFVWRMACLSAVLCAALLMMMIVVVLIANALTTSTPGNIDWGAGLFWLVGSGVIFGILGAAIGLAIGLLGGLILFVLTSAFFYPRPANSASYRRVAGWACASSVALVVLADWFLNGYPNTEDFGLLRFLGDTNAAPELSLLEILLFVIVPTLLLLLPAWFSARIVASQYANKHGGADGANDPPGSAESPS